MTAFKAYKPPTLHYIAVCASRNPCNINLNIKHCPSCGHFSNMKTKAAKHFSENICITGPD
jgi:hypothetical protein